jgi:serine/threonine protein phosphatase 1
MITPLRNFAQRLSRPAPVAASIPDGQRVYAVGDIHGRLDLLDALLARIDADDAARAPARTTIVFLGDLVDRGPESRGVVQRLLDLSRSGRDCRFLKGNHEEVFVAASGGEEKAARMLVRMGGRATAISYGVAESDYAGLSFADLAEHLRVLVPDEHRVFLDAFEPTVRIGDYLFVHAGIRPGVAIEEQSWQDLCWIRHQFLNHKGSFGPMVVHGHTVTQEVDERANRIGIDTGAYDSGRLTAIGLEGEARWYLST